MQGDAGSNILHAVSDILFVVLTAQSGGDKIMVNMAATGSVLGMLGMELSHFLHIIGEAFRKKGEVVLANKNVALARYELGVSNYARVPSS
jgi:Pyruvate/2-oxoacid:ferredoxin oxidoreductase gamma subunit